MTAQSKIDASATSFLHALESSIQRWKVFLHTCETENPTDLVSDKMASMTLLEPTFSAFITSFWNFPKVNPTT
jgi:hypothetical protein